MIDFDKYFLEQGDIIKKKDGTLFEVVSVITHVNCDDGLKISKNIKLKELAKFTEMSIDVDIKS